MFMHIPESRCHAILKCRKDGFDVDDDPRKLGSTELLRVRMRLADDYTVAAVVGGSIAESSCVAGGYLSPSGLGS